MSMGADCAVQPKTAVLPFDAQKGRAFLSAQLSAFRGSQTHVAVTVPAPLGRLEDVLCGAPNEGCLLFEPSEGPAYAAFGSAARFDLSGPSRMQRLKEASSALFRSLAHLVAPGAFGRPLRLFGGFGFGEEIPRRAPWEGFYPASFTLPRWTYATDGTDASLTVSVLADELGSAQVRSTIKGEYNEVVERLLCSPFSPQNASLGATIAHMPRTTWSGMVRSLLNQIDQGVLEKAVAARQTTVDFDEQISYLSTLHRLSGGDGDNTRFAFGRGGKMVLGKTPERLVEKSGRRLVSEAIAGSVSVGSRQAQSRLLQSSKDLSEHRFVVEFIRERLSRFSQDVHTPVEPEVRRFVHVAHLCTPIYGTLRRPVHVLDLVEHLHPTPAVGGVPQSLAVEWIRAHEPCARGWYAAPFGWFDERGDGAFFVNLRSGVLDGNKAHLYVGAGIVAGSEPEAEYAETELKQRGILAALGVR